jgi:hypothetical protein
MPPNCPRERTDKELPTFTKSRTDVPDPGNGIECDIEKELPTRLKLRTDKPLPRLRNPKTDNCSPDLAMERREKVEPRAR